MTKKIKKNKNKQTGGSNKNDFHYIINPITNRKVYINGTVGKNVLKKYYNHINNQNGGEGTYPNSIGKQLWSQDSNSNILKFNCDMNIPITEGCARFGNKSADPHGITYQNGGNNNKKLLSKPTKFKKKKQKKSKNKNK